MTPRRAMTLRLPEDLRARLASEAARNGASVNSEIVRAIREHLERTSTRERNDDRA